MKTEQFFAAAVCNAPKQIQQELSIRTREVDKLLNAKMIGCAPI